MSPTIAIIRSQDDGAGLKACRGLRKKSNESAAQHSHDDGFIASTQMAETHFD
jgi:hypothetical protein